MRIDRTAQQPPLPATPSWDNSTLRNRLLDRPEPGAAIEALHELARQRHEVSALSKRSRFRRRG